jgi:hypothetical protein
MTREPPPGYDRSYDRIRPINCKKKSRTIFVNCRENPLLMEKSTLTFKRALFIETYSCVFTS